MADHPGQRRAVRQAAGEDAWLDGGGQIGPACQNADHPLRRRQDQGNAGPLIELPVGREDVDLKLRSHYCASSVLAFARASSMVPTL